MGNTNAASAGGGVTNGSTSEGDATAAAAAPGGTTGTQDGGGGTKPILIEGSTPTPGFMASFQEVTRLFASRMNSMTGGAAASAPPSSSMEEADKSKIKDKDQDITTETAAKEKKSDDPTVQHDDSIGSVSQNTPAESAMEVVMKVSDAAAEGAIACKEKLSKTADECAVEAANSAKICVEELSNSAQVVIQVAHDAAKTTIDQATESLHASVGTLNAKIGQLSLQNTGEEKNANDNCSNKPENKIENVSTSNLSTEHQGKNSFTPGEAVVDPGIQNLSSTFQSSLGDIATAAQSDLTLTSAQLTNANDEAAAKAENELENLQSSVHASTPKDGSTENDKNDSQENKDEPVKESRRSSVKDFASRTFSNLGNFVKQLSRDDGARKNSASENITSDYSLLATEDVEEKKESENMSDTEEEMAPHEGKKRQVSARGAAAFSAMVREESIADPEIESEAPEVAQISMEGFHEDSDEPSELIEKEEICPESSNLDDLADNEYSSSPINSNNSQNLSVDVSPDVDEEANKYDESPIGDHPMILGSLGSTDSAFHDGSPEGDLPTTEAMRRESASLPDPILPEVISSPRNSITYQQPKLCGTGAMTIAGVPKLTWQNSSDLNDPVTENSYEANNNNGGVNEFKTAESSPVEAAGSSQITEDLADGKQSRSLHFDYLAPPQDADGLSDESPVSEDPVQQSDDEFLSTQVFTWELEAEAKRYAS